MLSQWCPQAVSWSLPVPFSSFLRSPSTVFARSAVSFLVWIWIRIFKGFETFFFFFFSKMWNNSGVCTSSSLDLLRSLLASRVFSMVFTCSFIFTHWLISLSNRFTCFRWCLTLKINYCWTVTTMESPLASQDPSFVAQSSPARIIL